MSQRLKIGQIVKLSNEATAHCIGGERRLKSTLDSFALKPLHGLIVKTYRSEFLDIDFHSYEGLVYTVKWMGHGSGRVTDEYDRNLEIVSAIENES